MLKRLVRVSRNQGSCRYLGFRTFSDSTNSEGPSKEVLDIAERICDLRLLEIRDLNKILKERLDIPDMSMGAGVQMMAAPVDDNEEGDAPAEEKVQTEFAVKLVDFNKIIKIKLIKELRVITGLGLKEAKGLVDNIPCEIVNGKPKQEAEEIVAKLKELGATVALE